MPLDKKIVPVGAAITDARLGLGLRRARSRSQNRQDDGGRNPHRLHFSSFNEGMTNTHYTTTPGKRGANFIVSAD
ncbi:hypothetical protein [Sinorhizobium terangae]|uniref:hypothetical protein n=1 Tax=Sinorhizobium terangae TaxID=110322 RepID=UPI0024B141CB|nr:hypothetical protein [Sinorhizobium terangae]WFU51646.1 hypothetical protein QA637_21410 [Sinorhizobium terangae]